MKIGIIEDDFAFVEEFKEIYYPRLISHSSDSENELICLNDIPEVAVLNSCDIVFLDIQLNENNSIDLLSAIMDKCDTKIIFLSANNHLVFDALTVKPVTFIRKSNISNDFDMLIKLYKKELFSRNKIKVFTQSGRAEMIYIDQIVYVLACGHDLSVITKNNTYFLKSSLKKTLVEFNDKFFVQIQKSLCINLRYIDNINDDVVSLRNGENVNVSRFFKTTLKQKYLEFILTGYV